MKKRKKNQQEYPLGALKLSKAAKYLDVSVITVRRLVNRGLLVPNHSTRHLLFPISELDRFLSQ